MCTTRGLKRGTSSIVKDFQAERNEFQRIPNLDSINLEEIITG